MTYELAIGDRSYSSWSLRGWLLFDAFDLPVRTRLGRIRTPEFGALLNDFPGARLVPALKVDDVVIWDSLAICETLAERHPDAGHWPAAPAARGLARSLVAEMHAGFATLRQVCPMVLRTAYAGGAPTPEVRADLDRLYDLWAMARAQSRSGPWLFGAYSAADAFFAPVAARIAGYGLPVEGPDRDYVMAHLAHNSFRRWRAMGAADPHIQHQYDTDLDQRPWPGPTPLPAQAILDGTPENDRCPYSSQPVAADALAQIDGRIVGFCNSFCRDKSVADPEAWPALVTMLGR